MELLYSNRFVNKVTSAVISTCGKIKPKKCLLVILFSLVTVSVNCQTERPIAVLQGMDMPTRVGCGAISSPYYAQDCNGYVAQDIHFAYAGSYRFDVSAYSLKVGTSYSNMQIR